MEYTTFLAQAKALGFARIGMCSTEPFKLQQDTVSAQLELKERRQLRFNPQDECAWATVLLVMLWPYQQAMLPRDERTVFVDSYYEASNQAYQAGKKLEEALCRMGHRAKANVSFPAKAAAIRAGLGVIGDHGLLITPEHGTRVVIILLATDAFAPDKEDELTPGICLHCGECSKACPTGAIDGKNGMAHPERCLRNCMMEGVVVPDEQRKRMGLKLIGCDICQRVCPMQPVSTLKEMPVFTLNDFLTADNNAFKAHVEQLGGLIGRNAARPQRVRAQAALIAGNSKHPEHLTVLREWVESESEAVREHAKWAIKQIERHMQGIDQSDEKR